MQQDVVEGLKLFIGRAKCIDCHMRPLLSNSSFPDIGLNNPKHRERAEGIDVVLSDEFNCLGRYSDAKPEECLELRFIDTNKSKYTGAFKTPTHRNVADRPPYMHAGQIKTLFEVLSFYRRSESDELEHKELSNTELSEVSDPERIWGSINVSRFSGGFEIPLQMVHDEALAFECPDVSFHEGFTLSVPAPVGILDSR